MPSPLVSVLIPCYNAERWIRQTLDSVRAQTWTNLEVIVVNDGSTDSSAQVVRTCNDSRLKLVSQPNRGQAGALNRGLAEAQGDYIQYLDADDLLHPQKVERQMRRLVAHPGCVASSEWARFYGEVDEARFVPDGTWRDLDPVNWLVEDWRRGGGMMFPALWLVPRPLAERAGAWCEDLTLAIDAEYFARVVLSASRVLFCEGSRAYYRSGIQGSQSGLKTEAGWRSQWKVLDRCQDHLLTAEDSERTRRSVAMLWMRFAHACYPYQTGLANQALTRARTLHSVHLEPEGGPLFRVASSLLGWKAARVLQRWSGRP